MNDSNPAAIVVRDDDESEDHLEYRVDRIADERTRRGELQYLVYWTGYSEPTWQPSNNLRETEALDDWLAYTAPVRGSNGRLSRNWKHALLKEQRSGRRAHGRTTLLASATNTTLGVLGLRTDRSTTTTLRRTPGPMVLPNAVGTSPTPYARNRDTTSESGKVLVASTGLLAVRTKVGVQTTAGMDEKGLEIGGTGAHKLASMDRRTGDNGREVTETGSPDGIVRRLTTRTTEQVKGTPKLNLSRLTNDRTNKVKEQTY